MCLCKNGNFLHTRAHARLSARAYVDIISCFMIARVHANRGIIRLCVCVSSVVFSFFFVLPEVCFEVVIYRSRQSWNFFLDYMVVRGGVCRVMRNGFFYVQWDNADAVDNIY